RAKILTEGRIRPDFINRTTSASCNVLGFPMKETSVLGQRRDRRFQLPSRTGRSFSTSASPSKLFLRISRRSTNTESHRKYFATKFISTSSCFISRSVYATLIKKETVNCKGFEDGLCLSGKTGEKIYGIKSSIAHVPPNARGLYVDIKNCIAQRINAMWRIKKIKAELEVRGSRITAWVKCMDLKHFTKNKYVEGDVIGIRNYWVESNVGKYRLTSHEFKIILHQGTQFLKIKGHFPVHRFNFKDFAELQDVDNIDEINLFGKHVVLFYFILNIRCVIIFTIIFFYYIYCPINCLNLKFNIKLYLCGLLVNDREYIDGITEASHWASAESLRRMFVSLLISGSLSRPDDVWRQSWILLSENILYRQRRLFNND
ncbi:Unknown protein, partial [Striga hermonthica]